MYRPTLLSRAGTSILLAGVLWATLIGCQPAQPGPGAIIVVSGEAPLPPKALLNLSELSPSITKPVNAVATSKPLTPQAQEAMDEAQRLTAQGDQTGAIDRLERALKFDPSNPRLHRMMGMAYAAISEFGKAMDNLRQAVAIAPDDLESQLILGIFLSGQKRDDQAIVAFRTALLCTGSSQGNPLTAEATYRLGILLQENGYWTAALECFNRVRSGLDKYSLDYAKRQFLKDVVLSPERLQTRCGELLLALRRPAEAAVELQKSFDANRGDIRTTRLLLGALIFVKDFTKAERLLVESAGQTSQAAQLTLLAESLCRASNDPGMPLRIWDAFRKHKRAEPSLAVVLARISERLGRKGQAVQILQSVTESMPGDIESTNALAGLYARMGQAPQALGVLAGLLEKNAAATAGIADGLRQVMLADADGKAGAPFVADALAAKSPEKLYVAASLALARSDYGGAIDLFGKAVDAKRGYLPAYEGLVDAYLAQDKYDRANAVIPGVAKDAYFASYLRGKVKYARGQLADASKELEASVKANKEFVPALLLWADVLMKSNQLDEAAEKALFPALRIDPDEVQVYRKLFEIYVAARRFGDAQVVVGKLLDRQPQSIQALMMMVELDLATGQKASALNIMGQLLDQAGDSADVNILAARCELAGSEGLTSKAHFEAAMKYIDAAIHADPRNATAWRLKGDLYVQPDRFDQAAQAYMKLHEIYPGKTAYSRLYAAMLIMSDQGATAAAMLEELLAAAPEDQSIRQAYVESLAKAKQFDKAESLLLKWIQTDTSKDKAAINVYRARLVSLYIAAKQYDKALKFVDQWLTVADNDFKPGLYRQKILLLGMMDQVDQAIVLVNDISAKSSEKSVPREALIAVLTEKKQYDKAVKLLDEWITRNVSDQSRTEMFQDFTASILVKAGKLDEARKFAESVTRKNPNNADVNRALIGAMITEKKYQQALNLVEGWLKQPAMTQPASALAPRARPTGKAGTTPPETKDWLQEIDVYLLRRLGRNDEALKKADLFLAADSDNVGVLNEKATLLMDMGRTMESIAILEKVQSMNPNDPGANNNLGYNYAEAGINLDKAEKMLKQALNDRDEISFQDSLAWIYYKQGRFGLAAGIFRDILRPREVPDEATQHCVIMDHAGDAYYRLGWTDKALEYWTRALEAAKAEKFDTSEAAAVLKLTPQKIQAVKAGKTPAVAPQAPPPAPTTKPATKPTTTKPATSKPAVATMPANK